MVLPLRCRTATRGYQRRLGPHRQLWELSAAQGQTGPGRGRLPTQAWRYVEPSSEVARAKGCSCPGRKDGSVEQLLERHRGEGRVLHKEARVSSARLGEVHVAEWVNDGVRPQPHLPLECCSIDSGGRCSSHITARPVFSLSSSTTPGPKTPDLSATSMYLKRLLGFGVSGLAHSWYLVSKPTIPSFPSPRSRTNTASNAQRL